MTSSQIVGAMSGRTAEVYHAYREHLQTLPPGCPFCAERMKTGPGVRERTRTMLVVVNEFPYAVWDSGHVEDHLMVVPVRHVTSLDAFSEDEMREFFSLARRYEALGYSVYSRSPGNQSRSVRHLHTHLIKTTGVVTSMPTV